MADSTDKTTPSTTPLEHPISEVDAQKFAGQGDFSLPVSPLDDLVGGTGTTAPVPTPTAINPEPVQPAKTEPVIEYSSFVPPTSQPQPQPIPGTPAPDTAKLPPLPITPGPTVPDTTKPKSEKELESKAKNMLTELNKAAPPKRRRGGSMVTKMALAAMVVVMMGAGGVVGMNILNQRNAGNVAVTDNRSEATGTATDYCPCECRPEDAAVGYRNCPGQDYCVASQVMCGNGMKCQCGDGKWYTTKKGDVVNGTTVSDCYSYCSAIGKPNDFTPGRCDCAWFDENGCGHDCTFDGDVQKILDEATKANNCKPVWAVCETKNGLWSTQEYDPNGKCKVSDCGNPIGKCTGEGSSYSCSSLTLNASAPKLGDTLTFTCKGSTSNMSIDHYEFQYKVGSGGMKSIPPTAAKASTATLKITEKGTYTVECRACKDATKCTSWGQAGTDGPQ